jgi:ADP-ribose pyrophosphatase YjhB (NUDIX family)
MRFLLKVWRWLPLPDWGRWGLTWWLTQKFLVGVMAVIFDKTGQVLLLNHTYRRAHSWGLPSGWLRAHESAVEAIVREVREETGYSIHAVRPLIIGGDEMRPRVDLVFLCQGDCGAFRPSAEVSEGRFFKLTALPESVEPYQRRLIFQAAGLLDQHDNH